MCLEQSTNIEIKKLELDFGQNAYVIFNKQNKQAVIIDLGSNADFVYNYIIKQGFTPVGVILTHGHFDHAGGCFDIMQKGVKVYIYKDEYNATFTQKNCAFVFGLDFKEFKADETFVKGDLEVGGLTFKVLPTPGHTDGSVCLILGDALFSGDTLFKGSYGRYDLISGNRKDLISSIVDTLFHLKQNYTIYPGHGEITTLEEEKENNFIWNEL